MTDWKKGWVKEQKISLQSKAKCARNKGLPQLDVEHGKKNWRLSNETTLSDDKVYRISMHGFLKKYWWPYDWEQLWTRIVDIPCTSSCRNDKLRMKKTTSCVPKLSQYTRERSRRQYWQQPKGPTGIKDPLPLEANDLLGKLARQENVNSIAIFSQNYLECRRWAKEENQFLVKKCKWRGSSKKLRIRRKFLQWNGSLSKAKRAMERRQKHSELWG